jgi:hypothetical protein
LCKFFHFFIKLSNLIIQWGCPQDYISFGTSVWFPIAFNTVFMVTAVNKAAANSYTTFHIGTVQNTYFIPYDHGTTGPQYSSMPMWIAIGT